MAFHPLLSFNRTFSIHITEYLLTISKHAPGIKVGNDRYPEFNLEKHPPGTAPQENTFSPNAESTIPGQAENATANPSTVTKASDTITGSTSADVHQGLGHPGSGMTSQEEHSVRRGQRAGLEGVGASGSDL